MIKSGTLSEVEQQVIHSWIRQVTFHGPESLGAKIWADHPLQDEWKGYRSSAFSNRGRIIYRVVDKVIKVKIARITTDHNYRK